MSEPFKTLTSKTLTLSQANIDTDQIIPARFLTTTTRVGLGKAAFYDWRYEADGSEKPEAILNRIDPTEHRILLAGRNFACGSSREHAPVAIVGAGIPVVIAHSFARIFYRNAFNMGLLPIELGDKAADIAEGDTLHIDLDKGVIHNARTGEDMVFPPLPPAMLELLQGGGLIEYVKKKLLAAKN